jgi:hypothetical protein
MFDVMLHCRLWQRNSSTQSNVVANSIAIVGITHDFPNHVNTLTVHDFVSIAIAIKLSK